MIEFTRQIGRADVNPGVLIHLSAEELGTVGPFLADDLGALRTSRCTDQQRAALPRNDVLRLVEGQCAHVTDRTERPALVARHHGLCGVLDHQQIVPARNVHDRVHLAADTRIVHGHDRTRALGDRRFDQALVDVQRVWPDIDEYRDRTAQHEGVGGRHKSVRGHDDLVAWFQIRQDRRHLQGCCARMRQQRLRGTGARFKPTRTFPGEESVAGQVAIGMGLSDVPEFLARHVGLVERNVHR